MFVKHGVADVPWYLLGLADVFGRPGAESKSHGHGRDLLLQTGGGHLKMWCIFSG